MGTFFADIFESFINDKDSPKLPRCILVALLIGFMAFVGIMVGINSDDWIGRLIGFFPSIALIALGIYLIIRICKN